MKWIQCMLLLLCTVGYGQTVSVKEGESPQKMVQDLLDNACVQISNTRMSSGQSVASFQNNGGDFPISRGVVIRSGKAKLTEGKYTGENLDSQVNSNGDPDLERINSKEGQSPLITDVAFLEFDFVPLSSNFNFNFLFASNEYGEWQCVSSDVFAFLLTDLSTGETTNLAVVPGTDTPVSVRTIKDNRFNPSCQSDSPQLFSEYQVDNPAASTINMRGYTKILNASATINPGNPYRIKLVIGDSNDEKYDSAIFLEAGSFSANVDLGPDMEFCYGDNYTIGTGLDTNLYAHTWTHNGAVVANENGNSLNVTRAGTYGVRVTKNGTSCLVTDEIVFSDLQVTPPKDLLVCYDENGDYIYDLTSNNEAALGIDDNVYDVMYYTSTAAISRDTPIPASSLKQFKSSGNQKIFMKLLNTRTQNTCQAVYDFQLLTYDPVEAHKPEPVEACHVPGVKTIVDITQVRSEVRGTQDPRLFRVTFHNNASDAQNDRNPISDPARYKFPEGQTTKTLWVRVHHNTNGCYNTTSFEIHLNEPPKVDSLKDVVLCSEYVLPEIQHGNYFTKPGGTGRALFAGDIITETGVYYIFNGPDENGCTSESDFRVTLVAKYGISEKHCGKFTVPGAPRGAFYTKPGGPKGGGTLLPTDTVLTESQMIYHYAEVNGEFCRDKGFQITILPLPPVDMLEDVVTCGSYVLPVLQNGNYFTKPGGNGRKMKPGEEITSSQKVYIYNKADICTSEHSFKISITPEFEDFEACGSYKLPELEIGGYYTQAQGQGERIPEGTVLTTSQRVYYYAETTTNPNCTDNVSFDVNVKPIPAVDQLEDVLLCEEQYYILPEISNGSFFTLPDRQGTELAAGTKIEETTTIYINNIDDGCSNETRFSVEIRPLPEVENFTDIYTCTSYELPTLKNGKYFTQPGGNGEEINGGELITTTQTLYVYNAWEDLPSCFNENAFTVYVEGIDVGDFEDVLVCDSYVLPELSKGNYFTESGGNGTRLKAGDIIEATQEIYVYSSSGTRFVCADQDSFIVTVARTPVLPDFNDVVACGSYTLPDPSGFDYELSYHWAPGGAGKISNSANTLTEPGNYTVYVYASAKNNPACVSESKFDVTVHPLLDLYIEGGTLCRNPQTGEVESEAVLNSGLNPEEFEVNWYFRNELVHTGASYAATEVGDYTVRTVKLKPEVGAECNYKPTVVSVDHSGVPTISAKITEPFEDVAVIRVTVERGFGNYQFSLDNGPFQENGEFYDVPSGAHTISAKGMAGECGSAVLDVVVLKYPKYFTPNKDGRNDIWTIPDLLGHPEARIHVFDRFGKLLKEFRPSEGWDGTFQGREMPSDDYWFRVAFELEGIPREFKSHFTLMRK